MRGFMPNDETLKIIAKREISVQEIQAQIERLLKNKDKFNNSVVIDVNKPVEDVVKDVSEYILETCASKVGR